MAESKRELYARAQRLLIASLLVDSDRITRVLELITEDDIEEPAYNLIFSSMAELSRRNEVVSQISVAEHLEKGGNLKSVGGPIALYSLFTEGKKAIQDAPVEVYSRIIKESSAKSKITVTLKDSLGSFQDDSGVQASEAVSELQSMLNEQLLSLSDSSTISKFATDFDDYLELLKERKRISEENAENADGLQGIPTMWPSINKYTTGFLPGQMVTVGAGTGRGKSVFAVDCALSAARANKSVMFFSLEMSKTEIEDRMLAASTGIPMNELKQGRLSEDQNKILRDQMEVMKDMKITIDIEPQQTIDSIRARALRQAQSREGLDFIIVDYLQLITPTGRFSSRQEAVADISRNMKLLAKQLGVPIMVLVQLKRKDTDDESSIPKLEEIRESGAIAQDSDVVILIHRDDASDDTIPLTLLILAKNRNGEADKIVRCHTNLACSLFREVTRAKDVETNFEDGDTESNTNNEFDADFDDADELDFGDLEDLEDFDLEL